MLYASRGIRLGVPRLQPRLGGRISIERVNWFVYVSNHRRSASTAPRCKHRSSHRSAPRPRLAAAALVRAKSSVMIEHRSIGREDSGAMEEVGEGVTWVTGEKVEGPETRVFMGRKFLEVKSQECSMYLCTGVAAAPRRAIPSWFYKLCEKKKKNLISNRSLYDFPSFMCIK